MMVGTVTVRIEGLKELEKALELLPEAVRGKALDAAAYKGAKLIRDEMRTRAPMRVNGVAKKFSKKSHMTRKPGYLKRHIVIKKVTERLAQQYAARGIDIHSSTYLVGPSAGAFYGQYLEFGSKHQAARPFARPAFDNTAQQAISLALEQLGTNIERQANRLARRINTRYLTRGY